MTLPESSALSQHGDPGRAAWPGVWVPVSDAGLLRPFTPTAASGTTYTQLGWGTANTTGGYRTVKQSSLVRQKTSRQGYRAPTPLVS
ncbi:hypothetical protein KIPB_011868 [Kipferlia bialata]|uniref:Uncharacterized protein n=1 Tax=Kipferlia bialata TaxID=797122 RepID=A0A391NZL6_9EUKA|nr:hypothetical protein KIPB_011868 [Kipferlia bialata]|eukprot:g11868.t1